MQRYGELLPVFYTTGLNAPYTEGHIQIARMIIKSLMLFGVQSAVFNFNYDDGSQAEDNFAELRIQQRIPFISRQSVLSRTRRAILIYTLMTETIKMPRFFMLEKALKHRNPVVNIVNGFRYPRILAKRMLSAPIILHFYIPQLLGRYAITLFANKADMMIASSQGIAQFLRNQGAAKEKIAIVYPPIDTELYKHSNKHLARAKLGLPKESAIILYIGNLSCARFPEDDVLRLVEEIAAMIPDTILLVFAPETNSNIFRAYEINRKAEILNLTSKLRIYVKNLSEKWKATIYAASDIFFFPGSGSRTAVEPPLTALEAMASGSVVFAPRFSALSEIIIDNENGFLFANGDSATLSNQLTNLLADRKLRDKLNQKARQTILNKASLATAGREMLRLQRSLLES